MIHLKALLTEIVSNPIIDLAKYLQFSDEEKASELAHDMLSGKIYNWILENYPQLKKQIEKFEFSGDAVEWLEHKDPQIFKQFLKYIYKETSHIDLYDEFDRPGYPTWNYMDFRGYVKNQWLIHFSDHASDIWADQTFKYGVDDYTELGLTTYYKDSHKQLGGYNFAYDVNDFVKYGRASYGRGWKYGKEAVVFRASGVKTWHFGDNEPQVIFLGNTAKDIVYVKHTSEADWAVINNRTFNYIYRDDLPKVVRWIITNFGQYRNVLLPS